jgi:hypothetical protein
MNRRAALSLASLLASVAIGRSSFASANAQATPTSGIATMSVLGGTRASFEAFWGAPTQSAVTAEFDYDTVMYSGSIGVVTVSYVVSADGVERPEDHAFNISIEAPTTSQWPLAFANFLADSLLPSDAKATSPLEAVKTTIEPSTDWQEQTFQSASVQTAIPDPVWYFGGVAGVVTVSIQQNTSSSYGSISVSTDGP